VKERVYKKRMAYLEKLLNKPFSLISGFSANVESAILGENSA